MFTNSYYRNESLCLCLPIAITRESLCLPIAITRVGMDVEQQLLLERLCCSITITRERESLCLPIDITRESLCLPILLHE